MKDSDGSRGVLPDSDGFQPQYILKNFLYKRNWVRKIFKSKRYFVSKLDLVKNTDLQAGICFGEGHKTIEGLQKREIPQSGICPAPCVPCLFTVVFAWAMPRILYL